MRRWIFIGASVVVMAGISTFVATRPPPFDAFPAPPSPSVAADGTRIFTIQSGTEVNIVASAIDPGDVIACIGKGRTVVPPLGQEANGRIYVYTDPNGSVVTSCEPHPLVEM